MSGSTMTKLCALSGDPYTYSGHSGIDFLRGSSWRGKPFYASGNGVVVRLSKNAAGGNWIVVKYDTIPYEVGYAHMDSHNGCPRPGTRVYRGTRLGYVGALGTRVTGAHVHQEIIGRATAAAVWDYFERSCWVTGAGAAPAETGGGTGWDEAKKQRFLTQIGLDTGGVGNGWGPKSEAATKTFQGWVGLPVDGKFGPNTIAAANTILGGGNYTTRDVKTIQGWFQALGLPVGPVDGVWGLKASLSTYMQQVRHNLTRDAKYGTATDAVTAPAAPNPEPKPDPEPAPGRNATSRPLIDIQKFLGVPVTNVWDKATSDAVFAFQEKNHLDSDRVWGVASDGLAFPPAGSLLGVDYSFARPGGATLKERGIQHVGRYLHDSGKGLTRPEYDDLRANGIEVWLIFERTGKELLGGLDAGVEAAKIAEAQRLALGLGPQPIYFNVDFDAQPSDMPAILSALDGIRGVIGLDRVGLYGSHAVIKAAFDAGRITWGFQTYSWSKGLWEPRAQLQQFANGQWGGTVDFTRAMATEYGQHPVEVTPPVDETVRVLKAELVQLRSDLEGAQRLMGSLAAKVTEWLS